MGARTAWLLLTIASLGLGGCYQPAHCQSGAKHGTQCYTQVGDDPPVTEKRSEDDASPRNQPPATAPR
ncbi:MAG: hypothetical protein JRI23_05355 [Deltaproteobacteria bacterium]|nr:hypothetical protein [Deltaproteobacteria bacterium]MBW2530979.1 hypothetical protein [Deltaproteobacteria bacterium]